ncbi:MAG: hypothetical protein ACJAZ9_001030 [Neolewinella sp.]|jgi:hypothetical protein
METVKRRGRLKVIMFLAFYTLKFGIDMRLKSKIESLKGRG